MIRVHLILMCLSVQNRDLSTAVTQRLTSASMEKIRQVDQSVHVNLCHISSSVVL